ncbi:MAG: molecular chaperone TorD family protein [Chloroflexota bacterium]|nr:molecular chaperone TorD family protein [Dehalococcoidia bacterium]MDW8046777.1 molecular chaperone TorD family protein [Chloroflexota bacterium]
MSELRQADGAALARAHQALYRFGALASAAGVPETDLLAAAELLRSHIVPHHPDPLVRHAWTRVLAHPTVPLAGEQSRLDTLLLMERTLRRAPSDPTDRLYELYLRAGVRPSGASPDELTAELDLAAELCAQEAQALESGQAAALERVLRLRRELLAEHLVPWLPVLCDVLETAADGAEILMSALAATCRFDWHRLEAAVGALEGRSE